MIGAQPAFWLEKRLAELSPAEWESLCDGCGKCCLYKIEDADTREIVYTSVACHLLDLANCQCRDYPNRQRLVSDCVKLDCENIATIDWLPTTCAYRLVAERKDLPKWHPLKSGNKASVHRAGASVRGWAISEEKVDDIEQHIIQWIP